MRFRRIIAAASAGAIALACGCSIRSSSDAAWPIGNVENKEKLTVSIDEFNKEYKFWLTEQQILDDTAAEVAEKCAGQRIAIINYLINEKIVLLQAEKLGITLTEEDQTEIDEIYNTTIDSYIEKYKSSVNAGETGTGEVMGEAAVQEEAEKLFDEKLADCGLTRDDILLSIRSSQIMEKLKDKLDEGVTVEFSEAEAEYKKITDGLKEMYEESPISYESNPYYSSYWIPENSRMIKHILLSFDAADSTEISTLRTNGDDEGADAAREAAAEKLKPQTDAIIAELDAGADFDKLMEEHSVDPGKVSNPDGYLVTPNGERYIHEFQQGAYELEKEGDYKLAVTDIGCHIMLYAADAVISEETQKEIVNVIYDDLKEDAKAEAYNTAMKQWRDEYSYEIAYSALNIEKPSETGESSSAAS